MEGSRDFGALVGRVMIAVIFVLSGFNKLMDPAAAMKGMGAHGLPILPAAFAVTILIEFGCALLLIIGYKARWAALLIFLWFIPATLVYHVHDYYTAVAQHNVAAAMVQRIMYLKNLSIMGGLLMIASFGPGRISLDGRGTGTAAAMDTRRAA
jgi:putative oxidoreductase